MGWDVSRVTNMWGTFYKAQSFNGDISKWDVSKVSDMAAMFEDAASFNADISKWDVSKVHDVKSMFHGAKSFSRKLCGSWANLPAGLKRNMFDKSDLSLFCKTRLDRTPPRDKVPDKYSVFHNGSGYRYRSTPEPVRDSSSYWEQHKYESSKNACSVLAGFEVPAIALMICLAITPAVSAHLLRKIEQVQPQIELLPAGKMVVMVQTCEGAVPALIKANVIDDAQVTNDANSPPGLNENRKE